MDPLTASWTDEQYAGFGVPAGTFESLNLLSCPPTAKSKPRNSENRHDLEVRSRTQKAGEYPLVLFSSGLGNLRLFYSAMAQQIASQGYVVVTIDHTYDAGIVVFPDNTTVLAANITSDEQIVEDLEVRVKDVSFVLDQLSGGLIVPGLENGCSIDTKRVGIFGHSLGGATAASAILADSRLAGGMNLDGTLFGPLSSPSPSVSINKPFVIFAHEGKNTTTDVSWAAFWPKLTGFKRLLELKGSAHGTFTDLPDVVDVLGLSSILPPEVAELLGTIDGTRAMAVIGAYVGTFFDFVLKGKKIGLLDRPSKEWPEVVFEHPAS